MSNDAKFLIGIPESPRGRSTAWRSTEIAGDKSLSYLNDTPHVRQAVAAPRTGLRHASREGGAS